LTIPAARLIARLHAGPAAGWRERPARAVVRSLRRKAAELAGTDPVLAARVSEVIDVLAERVPPAEVLVAGHGDFSPRNVLVTGRAPAPVVVALIDVDRMRRCGAGRDVAYWGAWDWATRVLAGVRATWAPAQEFTAAYLRARPEAAAELAVTGTFHRVAALIRIVHGWSALRGDPLAHRLVAEAHRLALAPAAAPGAPGPRTQGPGQDAGAGRWL
jgi:Ser/Thr protein kinase RdoA (MazF antagonist)